ncbi:MAG TPA: hypothetical protein VE908_12035 [Mycobacterium sp.]|nr:hypothetical protein [Mycobacterium sp.]
MKQLFSPTLVFASIGYRHEDSTRASPQASTKDGSVCKRRVQHSFERENTVVVGVVGDLGSDGATDLRRTLVAELTSTTEYLVLDLSWRQIRLNSLPDPVSGPVPVD